MAEEKITFTCPQCSGHGICEVMSDVVVTSRVQLDIMDDGYVHCSYSDVEHSDGEVQRYICAGCGFVIAEEDPESEQLSPEMLVRTIRELNAEQSS